MADPLRDLPRDLHDTIYDAVSLAVADGSRGMEAFHRIEAAVRAALSAPRLMELARIGAEKVHYDAMHSGDIGDQYYGHFQMNNGDWPDECEHPDCARYKSSAARSAQPQEPK